MKCKPDFLFLEEEVREIGVISVMVSLAQGFWKQKQNAGEPEYDSHVIGNRLMTLETLSSRT